MVPDVSGPKPVTSVGATSQLASPRLDDNPDSGMKVLRRILEQEVGDDLEFGLDWRLRLLEVAVGPSSDQVPRVALG